MPGRSLIVCRSLLPGGGGGGGFCSRGRRGCVSAPGGSVCSGEVSVCSGGGGVCSGEVSVCSGGRCLLRGCLFLGGVCVIPACTEADTSPPCEQNDKQVQKYYLGHNFVAAGNNYACLFRHDLYLHEECTQRTNMSTYCCHVYCGTTTDVAY